MSLNQDTINVAFAVPPFGQSISRTLIDGVMVIYDLDDPPAWLEAILMTQDENGNTDKALSIDNPPSGGTLIWCEPGEAITGAQR